MEFVGVVLGCLNLFLCFPAVSHLVRLGSVGKVSESGFSAAGSGKDGPIRQGVKLTFFFSDSHLAPKFFKEVANSKKVGRHFQRQTKSLFTLSAF